MTAKAEELEQLITLRTTNLFCDVALTCLIGVHAEVLSPGVAIQRVVCLPPLSEFILISIAATIDAIQVLPAISTTQQVAVPVGSSQSTTRITLGRIALFIHIVCRCRLFPDGGKTFIVDGANLVDTSQCSVWLHTSGIVVRREDPLEMSTDILCLFCQTCFRFKKAGKRFLAVLCVAV